MITTVDRGEALVVDQHSGLSCILMPWEHLVKTLRSVSFNWWLLWKWTNQEIGGPLCRQFSSGSNWIILWIYCYLFQLRKQSSRKPGSKLMLGSDESIDTGKGYNYIRKFDPKVEEFDPKGEEMRNEEEITPVLRNSPCSGDTQLQIHTRLFCKQKWGRKATLWVMGFVVAK